jgi:hypothetical protein
VLLVNPPPAQAPSAATGRIRHRAARWLAMGQGTYYLATGLWPLASMRSFEAVTGRKRDRWLVRTVGLLAVAFGSLLLRDASRARLPAWPARPQSELRVSGTGPAAV